MKSKSVIIIDDDQTISESMKDLFELKDIQVLGIAKDGKIGLELLSKCTPDKILLDIMMPQFDGIYFLKHVSKEFLENILICSGDLSLETQKELENFDRCIQFKKPINFEKLIQEIKN